MNTDKNMFGELLESNKNKMYRLCKLYAVAPYEPSDLFQEAIFQVWKSMDSFKGNASMDTWVYRITLNVCYDYNISTKKKNQSMVHLENIDIIPKKDEQNDTDSVRFEALRKCIALLAEKERTLVAFLLDDFSYKDISAITEMSENHVAVKMKRIRKTLQHCIIKNQKNEQISV